MVVPFKEKSKHTVQNIGDIFYFRSEITEYSFKNEALYMQGRFFFSQYNAIFRLVPN